MLADVLSFIRDRLYVWLRDQGLPHDVVAAVLAERRFDPSRAAAAARELAELTRRPTGPTSSPPTRAASASCVPCLRSYPLAPEHYTEPATRGLVRGAANQRISESANQRMIARWLGAVLRDLQAPINRFFTDVLVMAEDPAVRQARLALVQRIAALPDGIADLSQLQGF